MKHLHFLLYSAARIGDGRLDEPEKGHISTARAARSVFDTTYFDIENGSRETPRIYAGDFGSVIKKLDEASSTKGLSSGRKSIYEADPKDVEIALAYDALGIDDRLASGRERPRIPARPILRRPPTESGRRAVKGYGQPDASGKEVRRNSNKWLSGMTPEEISRVIVPTSQAEHFEMWADDMAGGSWKTNSKEREFLQKYYDELRANKNSLDIDYSPENVKITQETVRGMLESSPQMLWMFENFGSPMIISFTREAVSGFENSPEMKERLELHRQQRGTEKPQFISGLSSPAFGLIGLSPRALIDRESMTTDEKGVYPINLDPARIPQPRDAHIDRSLHGVIVHEYGHWLHDRAAWDSEANGKTRKEKSFYGSGDINDPLYSDALRVADEYMNPDTDNEAIQIWSEFMDLTERDAAEMFGANRDKALTATSYGNVNKREAIAEAFVAIMHPNKDMPKLALSKKLRDDVYALAGVDPNNLPWAARADGRPTIQLSSDAALGATTEDARPLISRLLDVIQTGKDRPVPSSSKESLSSGKKPHTPKWKSVEDIVDFETLGASSDDSPEEIEEVVRESLRDWEDWNPCRQIRMASYELAGIENYSDRDPNITQTDGFFGNSRYETVVSPEIRTEQARYIMAGIVDSLVNQNKYDRQPYLYRAMTFSSPQEAKQFFDTIQVGSEVDIPLIAFVDKGPSPSGGHFLTKFGTDALLVLEDFPGSLEMQGRFEPLFSSTDESDTLYNINEFAESILADIERGEIDEERIELDTEFANRLIKLVEDYTESRDPSERRRLKTEMGEALEETGNESINLEWEGEPLPEDHEEYYSAMEDDDSKRSAREHISGGRLEVVSVEPDPAGLYKEVVTLRQVGAFDPQEKGALVLKTDGQARSAALSSGNRNNSYNLVAIETDDSTPDMLESLKEKLGDALVSHETSTVDLGTRGQTNVRKKHTFTISSEKLRNTHAHNYATNRSFMAQIQELSSGAKPPQYPRKPTMGAFVGSADSEFDGITNWGDFKRAVADKEIVFIDYETTGLKFNQFNESAGNGLPTQIGAVKMKNGKVVERFNVFVNPGIPMSEWEKWSQDNLKDGDGNPITDAYLADKPSIAEAHKQLVEFMGNTELMGMQNAVFDNEVLEDALKESGIEWRPKGIIDTKEISDMVLPKWSETNPDAPFRVNKDGTKAPSNALGDITKFLGVDLGDKHHNADADAEATAKVLQAIIDGAIENGWPADVLDKDKRRDKENKTQIKFEKAVSEFEDAKKVFIENSERASLSSGDTLSSGSTILSQWMDVTASDSFGKSGSELGRTFGRADLEKLQKVLQDEKSSLSKTIDEWQKTGVWNGETNGVAMPRVPNPKSGITRNLSAEELEPFKDEMGPRFDGYLSQVEKQLNHVNDRLANLDRIENGGDAAHMNAASIIDLPNFAALAERGKKIRESRGANREWSLTKEDPDATWLIHTGAPILEGGVLDPSFTLPKGGDGTYGRQGMDTQRLNETTRNSIISRYEEAQRNFDAYQLALKEYDETGVWDGPKLAKTTRVPERDKDRKEYGTYTEGRDDEKIRPEYLRDIARNYIGDAERTMALYEYAYPLAKAGKEHLSYEHASQGPSRGYVRNAFPTSKTYLVRVPKREVVEGFPSQEYQIFGTRTPLASFEVPNQFNLPNMIEVEDASIALFEEAAQKYISKNKLSSGDNAGRLLRDMQLHDDEFEKKYNQKVPDGDGDCFSKAVEQARDLAETYESMKIAHGYPLGTGGDAEGLRFPHAWNEFMRDGAEWVRDYSNGNEVEIPKAVYYAIGNIAEQDVSVFSLEEAEKSMSENGHYGPW